MPPDHCPGPRCESLVDIYSQLQQEVGAAGGELEPKTRAVLISRLEEVLRTLVTRYARGAPAWSRADPTKEESGLVGRAQGGTQPLTPLVSSLLLPALSWWRSSPPRF